MCVSVRVCVFIQVRVCVYIYQHIYVCVRKYRTGLVVKVMVFLVELAPVRSL